MRERFNILLIMSDEHDPAVTGCYGHPYVETPHLDRLASEGTTFDNAYTACPICVPARMSFITGQYVHQIGAWDNGSPLPGSTPTIGSYLEASGYETVICGRTHFVGPERLLSIVDNSSLRDNTVVVYVSDHGEMGGHHGIWQKQCFYEHAVRVPMIIRHPKTPGNRRITSGTSLVDILPTLLDIARQEPAQLPGTSLLPAVTGDTFGDRPIFSEYHANGSTTGGYMIKKGPWKYIHYVGLPDQLFKVDVDPDETQNRADESVCANVLSDLRTDLLAIVDPEEIDQCAKENQKLEGFARAGSEG